MLRHFRERERAGGIDHHLVVDRDAGQRRTDEPVAMTMFFAV
jgi:hypothetical protein